MDREKAIRNLREGLEELRAEPMGEEEIMEMLRDVTRQAPARRWPVRAAAAAVSLLAVAGLALLLPWGADEPQLFAEGPQVAGSGETTVRPPPLRVPRSASWDRERYRLLYEIRPDEVVTRLSYEPADGGGRVRRTPPGEWPPRPRPAGAREDALVAALVAADADLPWRRVRETVSAGPLGVLYLAGTEPEGTIGAVAATVPTTPGQVAAMREIRRLGAAVTPKDLTGGFPKDRVLQLRITREEGGTRFRFGPHPYAETNQRFGLGDVRRSDAEVAGDGEAALPGLAAWVAGDAPRPRRALAFLEAGTGVRYVDVLRALESVKGAWLVDRFPVRPTPGWMELPAPARDADADILVEEREWGRHTIADVRANGEVRIRGRGAHAFGELPLEAAAGPVLLRADRRTAFSVCRSILEQVIDEGGTATLAFAPEDPEIPWERRVTLPIAAEVRRTVPVEITVLPDGNVRFTTPPLGPDVGVVLRAPDEATAGQIFPILLRLIREDAASIRFE